jgi:hypothetical protein
MDVYIYVRGLAYPVNVSISYSDGGTRPPVTERERVCVCVCARVREREREREDSPSPGDLLLRQRHAPCIVLLSCPVD